jgi:transcription elongation factor Elf1
MASTASEIKEGYLPLCRLPLPVLPEFACPGCGNDDASQIYTREGFDGYACGNCGQDYYPAVDDCPDKD